MSNTTVEIEHKGNVAVVRMNRPEAANTLNKELGQALFETALALQGDQAVRAVVLTGNGSSFCFGGDLKGMMASGADVTGYLRELTASLHAAITQFVRMDAPVVAAVNGTAAGAGIGLVAMADLAVAAESAKFASAYTGVALTPDGSTSFFLPRLLGPKRAMELMLTNRALTAKEACDWGLINEVVADADVVTRALAIAEKLAAGPRGAYGKTKRLVAASIGAMEAHLALEGETVSVQAGTPEGQEGIGAFLGKRKAKYI